MNGISQQIRRLDEATFHALLDALPVCMWVFQNGAATLFNRAMAELTGYSQDELEIPGFFSRVLGPESTALPTARGAARLRGEPVPDTYEIWLTTKRGERRCLEVRGTLVELPSGMASLVTGTDVTERKHLEQALALADARYVSLLDAAPVSVVIADPDGQPLHVNRAWLEFTGLTQQEVKEGGIRQSIHPDDRVRVRQTHEAGIASRKPYEVTMRIRAQDGQYRWYRWHVQPVRRHRGELLGWTAVATDVHEEHDLVERLEKSNAVLDAENRAKDEVLGMISHELRTPLTTLRGNASIISRRGSQLAPEDLHGALDDIGRDSERLQLIIENMLTLARAENGVSEPEPVLLGRLVPQVVEEVRASRPERKIELKRDGAALPVMGNPMYLRQVLLNLLSNAEKYSPAEAPITVRLREHAGTVTLSVEDRGPGIGEQDRKRLFEPFFRSESTAATRPGIGLGLTVCRRLAEEQHGRLHVAARQGGGTIFSLTLPLLSDEHLA